MNVKIPACRHSNVTLTSLWCHWCGYYLYQYPPGVWNQCHVSPFPYDVVSCIIVIVISSSSSSRSHNPQETWPPIMVGIIELDLLFTRRPHITWETWRSVRCSIMRMMERNHYWNCWSCSVLLTRGIRRTWVIWWLIEPKTHLKKGAGGGYNATPRYQFLRNVPLKSKNHYWVNVPQIT